MKYEVLIVPSAEGELEAAYRWIYERAPEAAVAWYNGRRPPLQATKRIRTVGKIEEAD